MTIPADAAGDAAVQLTAELIEIESVNPGLDPRSAGEGAIIEYLSNRLRAAGFQVEILQPPANPLRPSLFATFSSGPGPKIMFNGHVDTVGAGLMTDPFKALFAGDRLRGRGACDMKAGVAGMVVAAETAAKTCGGTVMLALVADEEDASIGTETLLKHLSDNAIRPDVCLVGEPSWLDLTAAHRGYAVVEVEFAGVAAHSSQPENGVNAVAHLGRLLEAVAEFDRQLQTRVPHPLVGHGSLMATVVSGGRAPFSLADSASALIERRTVPGEDSDQALGEVENLLNQLRNEDPAVDATCRLSHSRAPWELADDPFSIAVAGRLSAALAERGYPATRTGHPAWMESALFAEAGIPTLVCGPAGGGLHADDEWVDVRQVRDYTAVLIELINGMAEWEVDRTGQKRTTKRVFCLGG